MEVGHIFSGHVLRALGRANEAATHYSDAVHEAQSLVALDPTNANWQRDLGVARLAVARIDLERGRSRQALDQFRASIEVLEPLARKSAAPEAQRDLAKVQGGMAETFLALGDVQSAARQADAARASLQALADAQPKDADTRRDLAMAENVSGLVWTARKNPARATAAWEHSVELLDLLVRDSTDRNLLDPWVRAHLYLGRVDAARRGHEKLLSIGYRDMGYLRVWREVTGTPPSQP